MTELLSASPLWLYTVLVAGIIVLPGMDMAFVMGSALVDGRRAGAAAVAGIVAGGLVHTAMGALGIGLLLQAPRVFNALLLAGAIYVAWMGWTLWRGASALGEVRPEAPRLLWATAGRALMTCLLNPKAYVFMLAVFPPFLQVAPQAVLPRVLALGAITSVVQLLVYGGVALGAASLRHWLRAHGPAQVALGRGVGGLLLAVAAWTAWQGWQRGL